MALAISLGRNSTDVLKGRRQLSEAEEIPRGRCNEVYVLILTKQKKELWSEGHGDLIWLSCTVASWKSTLIQTDRLGEHNVFASFPGVLMLLHCIFALVIVCYDTSFTHALYLCFNYFFVVVQVQLSPFSPTTLPCAIHPQSYPFGFVHGSFIHVPWWPFPSFPALSTTSSPLVTVSLFCISMSLVPFCLFFLFVD